MVTVRSPSASLEGWTGPALREEPPSLRSAASSRARACLRQEPAAAPPAAPPLPAGFSPGRGPASWTATEGRTGRRPARLRNFNWEAIPEERIRGRQNVWTEEGQRRRRSFPLDLNFQLLEELFGQRPEPPGGSLRGQPAEQVSLLDAKKILNLGIFLKQFKRPVEEIVADIQDGAGTLYGAEKLLELTKMLPDVEEVKKLVEFQGNRSRLSEAEVFALLLVQVSSYDRRLELLVLKEAFFPQLHSLQSAIQILTEAALELLDCEELHDLIRLVLKAGNHMNEGGYAGSALGFRMPSLLRLADTKASQPGMDLLHFMASEAEKKDPSLLLFPSKLQHVGPASRIDDQEVAAELERLGQRLSGARGELEALDLEAQMGPFLHMAEVELRAVGSSREGLHRATAMLCDFLCEDMATFSLPECCGVFQAFGERFRAAVQENQAREAALSRQQQRQERERQEKQRRRRSVALGCSLSSRESGLQDAELDLLFLRSATAASAPRSSRRSRSLRVPRPMADSTQARERALHLSRRHTLSMLSPCSQPPAAAPEPPAAAPVPSDPPGPVRKAGLLGQGLKALLAPSTAAPARGPASPEAPSGFRLPSLFPKKALPERPAPPQASPKDISVLVGFFRRLSMGEKP